MTCRGCDSWKAPEQHYIFHDPWGTCKKTGETKHEDEECSAPEPEVPR